MADVVLQGYAADCAAAVHHLPCGIKHDGAARVSTFFVPQRARPATDDSGAERAAPLIAYFRGRELEGHEVELPAGVVGLVFQEAGRAGVGGASGAGGAGARTTGGVARASGAVAAPNAAAKAGTVGRGGYGPKSGGPAGYGPKSGGGAAARNSDDDDGGDDDDEPDIGFVMPPSDDDDDDEVEEDDCEGAGASAVATGGAADSVVASEASTASPATAAPATEADRVWRIDSAFTKVTYWYVSSVHAPGGGGRTAQGGRTTRVLRTDRVPAHDGRHSALVLCRHHDEPPGDTDMVRTAVDWFAIAAAVRHGVGCLGGRGHARAPHVSEHSAGGGCATRSHPPRDTPHPS